MRSKEYAAGAFVEGFAHFLSALAWNDHTQQDGWFKYYKEIQDASYADMAANQWRVDLEGAGLDVDVEVVIVGSQHPGIEVTDVVDPVDRHRLAAAQPGNIL